MAEDKTSRAYSVRLSPEVREDLITLVDQIKKENEFETNSQAYSYLISLSNQALLEKSVEPTITPFLENTSRYIAGLQASINDFAQSFQIYKDESEARENNKIQALTHSLAEMEKKLKEKEAEILELEKQLDGLTAYVEVLQEENNLAGETIEDLKKQVEIYKDNADLKKLFIELYEDNVNFQKIFKEKLSKNPKEGK